MSKKNTTIKQTGSRKNSLQPLAIIISCIVLLGGGWLLISAPQESNDDNTPATSQTSTQAESVTTSPTKIISPADAYELLSTSSVQLIDLREPEEYEASHIAGSTLLPLGQFSASISALEHEDPVLLYCRTGNRSGQAAYILENAGFTQIYDLQGGITAWEAAGLPLE